MELFTLSRRLKSGNKGEKLFTSVKDCKLETLIKLGRELFPEVKGMLGNDIESQIIPNSISGPCGENFILVVAMLDNTVHLFTVSAKLRDVYSAICIGSVDSKAVNSLMMIGRQNGKEVFCIQRSSRIFIYAIHEHKRTVNMLPISVLQATPAGDLPNDESVSAPAKAFRELIARLPTKLSTL
ncbi:MAG: hypothetical protein ACRC6V_03280 [Bacteroidales bacterium]